MTFSLNGRECKRSNLFDLRFLNGRFRQFKQSVKSDRKSEPLELKENGLCDIIWWKLSLSKLLVSS